MSYIAVCWFATPPSSRRSCNYKSTFPQFTDDRQAFEIVIGYWNIVRICAQPRDDRLGVIGVNAGQTRLGHQGDHPCIMSVELRQARSRETEINIIRVTTFELFQLLWLRSAIVNTTSQPISNGQRLLPVCYG